MTALLAHARHAARLVWAILLTSLAIAGVGLTAIFLRRRTASRVYEVIDDTVSKAWRARELAQDRAAVQIAAARAVQGAERDELIDILKDQDEDRQAARLMEAAKRIRGK